MLSLRQLGVGHNRLTEHSPERSGWWASSWCPPEWCHHSSRRGAHSCCSPSSGLWTVHFQGWQLMLQRKLSVRSWSVWHDEFGSLTWATYFGCDSIKSFYMVEEKPWMMWKSRKFVKGFWRSNTDTVELHDQQFCAPAWDWIITYLSCTLHYSYLF